MSLESPSAATPQSDWSPSRIIQSTLVVLLIALIFWLLITIRLALFSLFIAIVISTAMSPAVDWLHRRGLSRALGVVLIYLGVTLALIGVGWLLAPLLIEQAGNIANSYTLYYQSLRNLLLGSSSVLVRRLAFQLPASISLAPPEDPAGQTLELIVQVLSYSGPVGSALFSVVAVFLLAFFWTLEGERTIRSLLLLAPFSRRESIQAFVGEAMEKVGAYVRGLAVLSLTVGTLSFAAYSLIGLPYALLLGILAGLFEVIPLIGPLLGAIPAVLIALSTNPEQVIWVIGASILIQALENTFLVPRVMDRAVGVNPVVALLALAAFGSLFGLPGGLLAIPLAAVVQLLMGRLLLAPKEAEETMPEGRDALSVLRYEARQFVTDVRKQVRQKESQTDSATDEVEEKLEAVAQDLDSLLARASATEAER